jgi:hypothetical protein
MFGASRCLEIGVRTRRRSFRAHKLTTNWTAIAKFDGEFGAGAQTYGGASTLKYSR